MATALPLVNLLGLQEPLLAHLRQVLASQNPPVHVLAGADLAGVTEQAQLVPAVHLVYQGYRVLESRSDALATRLEQTWLLVVAVRNVHGLKSGSPAREQGGQLAATVAQAVMGWRGPQATPLKLVSGPAAGLSNGFMYVPLAFTTELALHAQI